IAAWLWFTVLFANFAEAVAQGRGKAQAARLRSTRRDVPAKRLAAPQPDAARTVVTAGALQKGDCVLVEAGDTIPGGGEGGGGVGGRSGGDGEVVGGVGRVDESAITGESAPVIRESGGDRSSATGGTRVLSDWLVVRITAGPGESFLDHMIAMIEGSKRQKT